MQNDGLQSFNLRVCRAVVDDERYFTTLSLAFLVELHHPLGEQLPCHPCLLVGVVPGRQLFHILETPRVG